MSTAGVPAPLDIRIDQKAYRSALGGTVEAIRGLAFALAPGSLTAVIGPSGCGKTTMLRIVVGLDRDFTGLVGRPADARIGFVFQEPRLLPWRTVEQNLRLVLPRGDGSDLRPLLAELGLETLSGAYPGELSLGLARRAAIARALVIDPDILILDEPLASLDETTAARLRLMILGAWRERRPTTLLVTHNIREAVQMADRLVLLSGRPSHVEAEIALDRLQAERDPAFVEAMRAELVQRYPALIA